MTTRSARALLQRVGTFMDAFSACFSRAPQRAAAWQTITWGTGTKGPLTADFLALRVRPTTSRGERWLRCERRPADGARKYYLLNLDAAASLPALVTLARSRWPIEQQYRELKDELGGDHFEGRTYRGWMHHTVLTAVAFTVLRAPATRRVSRSRQSASGCARSWACSASPTAVGC